MPEITESPDALATSPRIQPEALDEPLATVVDDPEDWLSAPSAQLGWRKPADLIGTDKVSACYRSVGTDGSNWLTPAVRLVSSALQR